MSSSLQGKRDSQRKLVSDEEAVVLSDNARPTDESPTVISKTPPIVEPSPSSLEFKVVDLNRKPSTPDSIVAGLRGRHLAHYELIEPIGVGGMAAVIRARDTQLDRFVALKILPPEMARENDNIERFHQEAKAAAKLDHENIARVFYCGEDQGLFFIAFEFVEGINLRTLMERRGRVPVGEAILYILQVAAGLEHAASRGVVHRDVKPSNIIITPTGRAKLVDMGLARNLERHGERDLTQSGVTLGTFDYISPEQALEPRDADSRSDIYSLGCTLYHMLTGQPPVPEGTPAKKLQHHQHHMPIDPRQIDATIPDEIVMILGKMMAKNPKDRYQRPIHLVQHLTQIAQKVGVTAELPDGGLFVDTPMPGKLRTRPVLIIGMALAALAALTLLLSLAPEPKPLVGSYAIPVKDNKDNKAAQVKPVGPSAPAPETVTDRAELQRVLDDLDAKKMVKVDLTGPTDIDDLKFSGKRLELAADRDENNTLRYRYQGGASEGGLILDSGDEVIFRKIRFLLESEKTPIDQGVATVVIRGAKKVTFDQCIFPQRVQRISTTAKRVPLASILIEPDPKDPVPVEVNINSCFFDYDGSTGGQVAVAINGPATVNVTDTAFKPHSAFFSFRDSCTLAKTTLNIDRCAGFVEKGPAFRFSKNASGTIRSRNNAFLRPSKEPSKKDNAVEQQVLVYLVGDKSIKFEAQQNLYYAFDVFAVRKGEPYTSLPKFLAQIDGSDDKSKIIDLFDPANPLQNPTLVASADRPDAFQLKESYYRTYGLQKTWLGPMTPPAVAVESVKKLPVPKNKIVDPDDDGTTAGVFTNLRAALSAATGKEVIEIKHSDKKGDKKDDNQYRQVVVPPVVLQPGVSVTLRPHEGYQPILVLDHAFEENDSALFKVQKSTLQLEQMEIVIEPKKGYKTRSIVQMGEAHVVFKNCFITLRAPDEDVELSVASFLELDKMMKMEGPAPAASRVEFHECFIRGRGDVVAMRGCRKLNVEMTKSLVVLDGSLLDVQATGKAMPMSEGVRWTMDKSSVFTTEAIFALRALNGRSLTETQADFDGCLLVSLDPAQPIVLFDMDKSADREKLLKWNGKKIFYANFVNHRDWKDQYPEMTSEYGQLMFSLNLSDEKLKTLWEATPDWFKPMGAEQQKLIQGFGLPPELEKGLMQPALDPEQS